MKSMRGVIDIKDIRCLSLIDETNVAEYLAAARDFLERTLRDPNVLDLPSLKRKPGGYALNLLFGDTNLSLFAIVWAPGSRTSIHDHHCTCCFGVLAGRLREVRYRRIDGTSASLVDQSVYGPGTVECMVPCGPNLHRMINDTDAEAVSLHLYGFDHRTVRSSIAREYSAVPC